MSNTTPSESCEVACDLIAGHTAAISDLMGTLETADRLHAARSLKKLFEKQEAADVDAVKQLYSPTTSVGSFAYRQEVAGNVSWKAVAEKLAAGAGTALDDAFLQPFKAKPYFKVMVEDVPDILCLVEKHPVWAVLDFETTGLTADDRIVEVGIHIVDSRTGEFDTYSSRVCPENRKSHPKAFEAHGIPDADLVDAPKWADMKPEVEARLEGSLLIAQNLPFEKRFLAQHGIVGGWAAEADTKVLGAMYAPGLRSYSLDSLLDHF